MRRPCTLVGAHSFVMALHSNAIQTHLSFVRLILRVAHFACIVLENACQRRASRARRVHSRRSVPLAPETSERAHRHPLSMSSKPSGGFFVRVVRIFGMMGDLLRNELVRASYESCCSAEAARAGRKADRAFSNELSDRDISLLLLPLSPLGETFDGGDQAR